ncbi:MAG: peroxiredoxin family protein [Chloroflexota bacterium]
MENQTASINLTIENGGAAVGKPAPRFSLPSIQGQSISLKDYAGKKNVLLWFSRGFTCPFCRDFMENVVDGYGQLQQKNIEIIQIAPNIHHRAVSFFGDMAPPFPLICDPDKRLFATYGLGDDGILRAQRNTIASFSYAARKGEFWKTTRASAMDVFDRSFVRRLHHHALTAVNQAIVGIDINGKITSKLDIGALESIPSTPKMIQLLEPTVH